MADIDLIPLEYHQKLKFTHWIKKTGFALVIISTLIITAFLLLRVESDNLNSEIKHLQSQKAITNTHRKKLETLNQQKKDLDQQLKLLAGLRSGAAAEQMFITIDNALPEENVWVTGWKFRRAGTPVEKKDEGVNTGYFVVIPQTTGNNRQQREETWKIETQMTLRGQSMDHAALSEFVLNLTRQREIANARVVRTQLIEKNRIKLVDFTLEIVVSSYSRKTT